MITLVFFAITLVSDPNMMHFPGYQAIPSPKPEDCIIVPLDNPKPAIIYSNQDPVLTA